MRKYIIVKYRVGTNYRELDVVAECEHYEEAVAQCNWYNRNNIWEGVQYSIFQAVES